MASSLLYFFVFVTLFLCVNSCTLTFKDCGSKFAKVSAVNFNGTCEKNIAILKKGTYVQLQISMNPNEASTKLTSKVHGIIAGIPVPFPLGNPDACEDCNITCPLQKGKPYVYSPTIAVLKSYPSISLVVKWELKDDNDADLICIDLPAKIQ